MNNRFILRIVLYLIVLVIAVWILLKSNKTITRKNAPHRTHIPVTVNYDSTALKYTEAFQYSLANGFRTDFAILIDLSMHSGNYRFFAMDLDNKKQLIKGLVAHGHCRSTDNRFAQFSNELGSNCSSLGRFRIGKKYVGQYGTSYKLHGLDTTNSNALERFVVLHGDLCVPEVAQEDDICLSEGCPTVNPLVLKQMEPYLDTNGKPILLWIYN